MLQLSYAFVNEVLLKHRLAFLPHPDLPLFQNTPEEYLEDALYADVLDHKIVCVPLRFDFDRTNGVAHDVTHPVSHLTLGQYAGCRIAATTALTPFDFVELILRAFYNTASRSITTALPGRVLRPGELHAKTITQAEGALAHIGVPG